MVLQKEPSRCIARLTARICVHQGSFSISHFLINTGVPGRTTAVDFGVQASAESSRFGAYWVKYVKPWLRISFVITGFVIMGFRWEDHTDEEKA